MIDTTVTSQPGQIQQYQNLISAVLVILAWIISSLVHHKKVQ